MEKFKFKDIDGTEILVRKWAKINNKPKCVIQIAHGMAEESSRYDYVAQRLNEEGYIVYANDHRGHGETAESREELGYISDEDGFQWMVNNIKQLNDIIKKEYSGLPIVLLGHSMGSFLSQRYAEIYGDSIDYLVLTGTNGKPKLITKLGIKITKRDIKKYGRKHTGRLINKFAFDAYNNNFKPTRTQFDWLSSVDEEVDEYIKNDLCGFKCSSSFYYDFINGLWNIHKNENLCGIPESLPIYIFAGDKDPVGYSGKGILSLYKCFKDLIINDVSYKLYKDGRHEMFHEYNKDQVIDDLILWLNKRI